LEKDFPRRKVRAQFLACPQRALLYLNMFQTFHIWLPSWYGFAVEISFLIIFQTT
jgi:hypothetical protein